MVGLLTACSGGSSPAIPDAADTTAESSATNPPTAAAGQIIGVLFFDRDLDGRRDPDEPGIPGIHVSAQRRSAMTGPDGSYVLDGLSGSPDLRVHSAWFRTQCDALDCPAGPGPDNDVAVENQLLFARDVDVAGGANVDVGLIPDWSGETSYPLPAPGFTPNDRDLAVRLSRVPVEGSADECSRGADNEHACQPGDHPTASLGIHNQGTEPMTDVVVAIDMPDGFSLDAAAVSTTLPGPALSVVVESPQSGSATARITTRGSIEPGAVGYVTIRAVVDADASGTPSPLPTRNPYDRIVYARIVRSSHPDADSALCEGWSDCRVEPGPHDKLSDFDEVDGSGWNIAASTGPAPVADLDLAAQCRRQGSQRQCVVTITNTGTVTLRNIALRARLGDQLLSTPDGWTVDSDRDAVTRWTDLVAPNGTVTRELTIDDGPSGAADVTFLIDEAATSTQVPGGTGFNPADLANSETALASA